MFRRLAGRISVVTKGIKPQWKVACAASAIVSRNGYAAFPCVKAFVRDLHNHQAQLYSREGHVSQTVDHIVTVSKTGFAMLTSSEPRIETV